MTERTSRLTELWIGAAISNTSHSNKASSTTVKRARLNVKDKGRRQCCHNKHKKFPYRPTRYVSLLSGLASYYKVNFRFRQNPLRRTAALIGAKVRRFGNRVEVHHQGRRYWSFMYM